MVSTHTSRAMVVGAMVHQLAMAAMEDWRMEVSQGSVVGTGTSGRGEAWELVPVVVVDLTWELAVGRVPRVARDHLLVELLAAGMCTRLRRGTVYT